MKPKEEKKAGKVKTAVLSVTKKQAQKDLKKKEEEGQTVPMDIDKDDVRMKR